MKKFCLAITALLLLIFCAGLKAQTVPARLDQQKLMQQYLGTWQANAGKDTLEVWDFQQFGKTLIINTSNVIKGKKNPLYVNNLGFDAKESKFKGYVLMNDGSYGTWIGAFTSDKKFEGIDVVDFNTSMTYAKFENVMTDAKSFIWTSVGSDGSKSVLKFSKVK